MKLYNLIDSFFETRSQRHAWLGILFFGWMMWQAFWTLLVLWKLLFISDYDGLFDLYSRIDLYTSSLLVRMVVCLMSLPSFSFLNILKAVTVNTFTAADALILLAGVLYILGLKKRVMPAIVFGSVGIQVVILILCVVLSLSASSLAGAILNLRVAAGACMVFGLLALCICVISFFTLVSDAIGMETF